MSDPTRKHAVDALRGVALIGICVVNLPFMALPADTLFSRPDALPDQAAQFAVALMFQAKFFLLFSFAFGWGIEIQAEAAARAGAAFAPRFGRRLAALAVLGALHAVLVFVGDILLLYAALGLLAWPFRDIAPRRQWQVAAAMLPLAVLCLLALALLLDAAPSPPPGPGLGGSYAETVAQRLADWPGTLLFLLLFQGHLAFGAFLAGMAAARSGFFEGAGAQRLRRAVPWLLGLGLPANLAFAWSVSGGSEAAGLAALLGFAAIAVGGPLFAAAYLSLILAWAERWRPPVWLVLGGRNSLSCYVLQGVLAGLVFGGDGLGLFGRLGHAALLPLSLGLAVVAMLLVSGFASRFGRGPLEALLRRVTYG
jgi:uncharacterized protein